MNYNTIFSATVKAESILSITAELIRDIDTAHFQPVANRFTSYLKTQFIKDAAYGFCYSLVVIHTFVIVPTVHFIQAFLHVSTPVTVDESYAEENLPAVTEMSELDTLQIFAVAATQILVQLDLVAVIIEKQNTEVSENATVTEELKLSEMTLTEFQQYAKSLAIKGWNLYKSTDKLLAKIEASTR